MLEAVIQDLIRQQRPYYLLQDNGSVIDMWVL